jgi:hypothetical protein
MYADPIGLVQRTVSEADPSLTTVTPRLVPIPKPPRRVSTGEDMEGVRVGHENFHTLREYVFGDEPRKIHWRSSARAQKLLVRVSVDAAEEQTLVVLDVEGAEADVLNGFDLARFKPRVLLIEDIEIKSSTPLTSYMQSQDYHPLGFLEVNRIYVHKDEKEILERIGFRPS